MSEDMAISLRVDHIRKAWLYNASARAMASCNHVYMGSMSSHRVLSILGVDSFDRKILFRVGLKRLTKASDYLERSGFPWHKVKNIPLPEDKE